MVVKSPITLVKRILQQAYIGCFLMSTLAISNWLINWVNPVVMGSANVIAMRPVEAFREAIILDAPSVVLVHNHPSGDPRPSPQDISPTKTFIAAGKILDLDVEDHVIIGANSWVSMKREHLAFT